MLDAIFALKVVCLAPRKGLFTVTRDYRWEKLRQSEMIQWVCYQHVQNQEPSLCLLRLETQEKLPEMISLQPSMLLHLKLSCTG